MLHHQYNGHTGPVYTLCEGLDQTFLSAGGDRLVVKWSMKNASDGELILKANDAVFALCHLPAIQTLLVGTGNGSIHVADLLAGKETRLLHLHESFVFSIVSSSDGKYCCTTGGDGLLNVLQTEDFAIMKRLRLTENKLRTVVFHSVYPLALAGCGDGTIVQIDTDSWKPMYRFGAHEPGFSVNCICFSPDGKYFLSGSRDAHLHLYETENMKRIMSIPAHNYAIYAISFDPSGQYFATASRDKTVKLWDFNSMTVIKRLERNDGKGHVNSVNTLLWLKSGQLLSGGDDRTIACWNISDKPA